MEPIKCMRSPHTSNSWRGERVKSQSSVCLATHQLQVEMRGVIEPISVCAHHTPATGGERERDIEPIKCMRSPHSSTRERRERHRANQVYALTTQSTVERREDIGSIE